MTTPRQIKDTLYQQVARVGKALSSPKRLELVELLCQGEMHVEQLATEAGISLKLASAHLKELRLAQLVAVRREGRKVFYSLVDDQVADLWVSLRVCAENRLLELRSALSEVVSHPHELSALNGKSLLSQARRGELTVIDVRPVSEYAQAHLPYARSMPLDELRQRLDELPPERPVVAYCRGPFCLLAKDAVALLARAGVNATRLEDGVAEWRARGLPLAH